LSYFLKQNFLKNLELSRKIIPLIDHPNLEETLDYIDLLQANNFKIVEFTLRHSNSMKHIIDIRKKFPNLVLGAGSITSKSMFTQLSKSKIDFFVSPGLIKELSIGFPNYLPGVFTPTDILNSQKREILKLFPSNIIDLNTYLKVLRGPFPKLKFIPTGGIDEKNVKSILSHSNVFAVAGSFMCPKKNNSIDFNKLKKLLKLF